MKVEQAKKQNEFREHYENYQENLKMIEQEQNALKKELKKQEDEIRDYIADKFSNLKDTFEECFVPTLSSDNSGQVIIHMRDQFSFIFTLEFSSVNQIKKPGIKLSARMSASHQYSRSLPPAQTVTENYKEFIDKMFDVFLRKFNELIIIFEQTKMQQALSQEIKNPN
jgi:hypothetical protein